MSPAAEGGFLTTGSPGKSQKESFTTYCLVLPPISEVQHVDEHSGHLINARNLQFMNACVQMFSCKPLDI